MYKNISIFVPSEEAISRCRFLNWLGGIALLLVLLTQPIHAQSESNLELGDNVTDYAGEDEMPKSAPLFESDQKVEDAIAKIAELAGLPARFEVLAAGVPNVASIIRNGKRYILYNPTFMRDMEQNVGTHWAPRSILAHEVGHHLSAHTFESGNEKRHQFELEADYFSGNILGKWGASLDEAQAAMKALGREHASSKLPSKIDRLAAIAAGWQASRGAASNGNTTDDGTNSCEYAHDGVCDEGNSCAIGTDTADCGEDRGQPNLRREPDLHEEEEQPASACCNPSTGQPVCQMATPLPRGVPCNCGGYPGGLTCY